MRDLATILAILEPTREVVAVSVAEVRPVRRRSAATSWASVTASGQSASPGHVPMESRSVASSDSSGARPASTMLQNHSVFGGGAFGLKSGEIDRVQIGGDVLGAVLDIEPVMQGRRSSRREGLPARRSDQAAK